MTSFTFTCITGTRIPVGITAPGTLCTTICPSYLVSRDFACYYVVRKDPRAAAREEERQQRQASKVRIARAPTETQSCSQISLEFWFKQIPRSSVKMLRTLQRTIQVQGRRSLSTEPFLPQITDRRLNEQGPGGRSTNAGVRVAVFGATGFLGKHVCQQLGKKETGLECGRVAIVSLV